MYIYKITNLINNKIYIGQTVKKINYRFSEHKYASKKEKYKHIILYKAMNKYGLENFKIEEIDKTNNINCLNKKEIYWIKKLNTTNITIGYNMCLGGNNTKGRKTDEKTKLKISEKAKERCKNKKIYFNTRSIGAFDDKKLIASFVSYAEAARYTKLSEASIRKYIDTKTKIFGYNWKKIKPIEQNNCINFKRKNKEKTLFKIDPLTFEIIEKMNKKPSKSLRSEIINSIDETFDKYRWVTKNSNINFKINKFILEKNNEKIEFLYINNIGKEKINQFFKVKKLDRFLKAYREEKEYKGYKIFHEEIIINKTY